MRLTIDIEIPDDFSGVSEEALYELSQLFASEDHKFQTLRIEILSQYLRKRDARQLLSRSDIPVKRKAMSIVKPIRRRVSEEDEPPSMEEFLRG